MPKTETNLNNFKINILTEAQYREALNANQINENELYMTPEAVLSLTWEAIQNKPTTFTPSDHGHTKSQITDFPTKLSQFTNDSGFKTTDNNTTYSLSKSGSTITLTGSDGSKTSVTDSDSDTTYSNFVGATYYYSGSSGLVPAPYAGEENKYLRGDGTWQYPPSNSYTLSSFGITATSTELNYCDGVTSNIQTQINDINNTIGNVESVLASILGV